MKFISGVTYITKIKDAYNLDLSWGLSARLLSFSKRMAELWPEAPITEPPG
jgi:hypothetical protein